MLAIVFWNARRNGVDAGEYESALREFHAALNRDKPVGFRFSASHRVGALPWFKPKSEVFEDWYVLSNFAAIDALDHAVMNTGSKDAHAFLMSGTTGASGAIVGLQKGVASTGALPEAYWMLKPRAVSVQQLIENVRAQLPGGKCSFWTRALALGPAEHCLLSSGPVRIPDDYRPIHVHREPLWQSASGRR